MLSFVTQHIILNFVMKLFYSHVRVFNYTVNVNESMFISLKAAFSRSSRDDGRGEKNTNAENALATFLYT